MKKEGIVAIIFGILLGLAVAFFVVWRIRGTETQGTKLAGPTPTVAIRKDVAVTENTLEISSPATGHVTSANTVKITGTVQKGSVIIAQSALSEKIVKSTSEKFTMDFPLAIGENVILIAAYPQDKTLRSQQKTITIYYLDEQ